MPRPYRGPLLYLDPRRKTWTILCSRGKNIRTGYAEDQREQAALALASYANGDFLPRNLPQSPRTNKNARKGVYVLGFGPYIKIGISVDVDDRISQLQTPEPVHLYAVLDGWAAEEKALHRRFAEYRLRGEWFRNEGDLAEWIKKGPAPD